MVSLDKTSPNNNNNNNNNKNSNNNKNNNINNNNRKHNSLKASLSLDPAALVQQPLPYVNVNMTPSHVVATEVESRERPFTVQTAASRNLLLDNEISC
jgi:hypothetical protein